MEIIILFGGCKSGEGNVPWAYVKNFVLHSRSRGLCWGHIDFAHQEKNFPTKWVIVPISRG
jgi:hypothetical protein